MLSREPHYEVHYLKFFFCKQHKQQQQFKLLLLLQIHNYEMFSLIIFINFSFDIFMLFVINYHTKLINQLVR